MKALVWHGVGDVRLDTVADPKLIERPKSGPAAETIDPDEADQERRAAAPEAQPQGRQWVPGDAPSLAARWAVEAAAKAGSVGVIGVYPPGFSSFPVGLAMNKNLTLNMGNCNHRRYVPKLVGMVGTGKLDPTQFITAREPESAVAAYESFDRREDGWLKTVVSV